MRCFFFGHFCPECNISSIEKIKDFFVLPCFFASVSGNGFLKSSKLKKEQG